MRRLLVAVLLLAVVATVVVVVRSTSDEPPGASAAALAPSARTARDFAVAACVRVRLVEQGVQANSAAADVTRSLREARVLAAEAARRDPVWIGLSGGVAALDEAVRADDGTAASIGLRAARAMCVPR